MRFHLKSRSKERTNYQTNRPSQQTFELFFLGQPLKSASINGMSPLNFLVRTSNRRIAIIALLVIALDQLTKQIVLRFLGYAQQKVIIDGFFKFVHWGNTGAAWSLFRGNNELLAGVALLALILLFLSRHHFDSRTLLSQVAFGMICGGIVGNLIDRLWARHVIDFIYFYLEQRGGAEIGFPAFNVADSAICTGVGLVFLITWRSDHPAKPAESSPSQ
jgi:signal peptidase II